MVGLSDKDLKAIVARRDRRFDGRFYFGVKTTKIYCRPICPARPKPENIVIFRSLSEAEKNGYRPCLRCRPDLAPGSNYFSGTLNTISRALRLIQNSRDQDLDVGSLAASLGISDRHMRRLFEEHLGASPAQVIATERLHFAKQVLEQTSLPITAIAFTAGFKSIRRFNEAFKERFRVSPREFRRGRPVAEAQGTTLKIPIHLPYDSRTVFKYLKKHESASIEVITEHSYRRFLPQGSTFGTVSVSHPAGKSYLEAKFINIALIDIRLYLSRLKNLFDADHNPSDLPKETKLVPAGIRVPGSFDPFETAVAIILGQLVSTEGAKATLKKFIHRWGKRLGDTEDGDAVYAFPSADKIGSLDVSDLCSIGITRSKAGAIHSLAAQVAARQIELSSHCDLQRTAGSLLEIKGIGPWTASMIAMRCLANPDAFPEFDLIVQRACEAKLVSVKNWGSSRAYLVHCLWRDYGASLAKAKGAKL